MNMNESGPAPSVNHPYNSALHPPLSFLSIVNMHLRTSVFCTFHS
jgi:hypothetical protein